MMGPGAPSILPPRFTMTCGGVPKAPRACITQLQRYPQAAPRGFGHAAAMDGKGCGGWKEQRVLLCAQRRLTSVPGPISASAWPTRPPPTIVHAWGVRGWG
jgi:hypothetical protein